jgi:hypothetical protein
MTVLFKVAPTPIDGDVVRVAAPLYGELLLAPGDRIFLWWSEAQGGRGLAGHGVCVSAASIGKKLLQADIEPITLADTGFGRAQLRPHREGRGGAPETTLAAKLYRHALNKVVAISAAEEAFLDALFTT